MNKLIKKQKEIKLTIDTPHLYQKTQKKSNGLFYRMGQCISCKNTLYIL